MVHVADGCPSPSALTVVSSPGNRAAEGGDGAVGEPAVLGGHAGGVWRPPVSGVVQPLRTAELQEEPAGARPRPSGDDHRGGRHRDTTQLVPPAHRKTGSPFWEYVHARSDFIGTF